MHPSRRGHRAKAMSDDDCVFQRNAVGGSEMTRPLFGIADHASKTRCRASFTGGVTVAALVPGENGHVFQSKTLNSFLPAFGMFMAAMKEKQCFGGRLFRNPRAVKQLRAVAKHQCVFSRGMQSSRAM